MVSSHFTAKRWTALFIIALLINSSITLLFDNAEADGIGNYPAPTDGDWIITEETEVSDEIIILNGNLIIEADGRLLLENTTILFNCTFDGEFGVLVKDGGGLQAIGDKDFTDGARIPGDFDMFSGSHDGQIRFYRNNGTREEPDWQERVDLKDVNGDNVDPGSRTAPFLADLDNDGDFDIIIGEQGSNGQVNYYENTGTATEPAWTRDDSMFTGVTNEDHSKPALADLDNDGDLDLAVGNEDGELRWFRNIGTPEEAEWDSREDMKDKNGDDIDIGTRCWPRFADLDNDGDFDMALGSSGNPKIRFYRNTGTPESHEWTEENSMFSGVSAGQYNAAPAFADLDYDGDLDLTIGSYQQGLFYYENTGSIDEPVWTEDESMYSDIENQYRMQPAFADIDGDGPGFIPGAPVWNTEFNTTGDFTFDFVVEDGAAFEMEQTRIRKCGNGDPGHPGLTINTDDVRIVDNLFEECAIGIVVNGSSNSQIRENTFLNNSIGIQIQKGSDNSLINNTFITNDKGIILRETREVTLHHSIFEGCSVLIEGMASEDFSTHDFFNNTVNSGPLHYYANVNGITVPENASAVIIANCTDMKLTGLNTTEGDVGIELAYVRDSLISESLITGFDVGIYLFDSDNNTIRYNTVLDGDTGMIFQGGSSGNAIHFNTITGNTQNGVDVSVNGGTVVNAVRNNWGDASGPFHAGANPSGKGDTVTDDILFDPWLAAPQGTNIWYVDAAATPGGNGAFDTPFTSIQDGLNMASQGEDIMVFPGIYSENLIVNRFVDIFGIQGEVTLDAAGGTGVTVKEEARNSIIANITITNGATDLELEADTNLFNTSFNSGKVTFIGDSLLSVGYYLDVSVVDVDEKPVANAVLDMTDDQSQTQSYFTDSDGRIDDIMVLEYLRNATGTVQFTPYQLYAFNFTFGYSRTELDIHEDTSIILNLNRHGSFGTSIATGDLDGDGFEDIAIGAPTDDQNGEDSGAVFIFFNTLGGDKVLRPIDADLIIHGEGEGNRFGTTLALGDIDDDDNDELIVGSSEFVQTTTGINGMYYNGEDFTDLEFTRIDSNIDFPWGNDDPGGLGQRFSVYWYGYLYVDEGDNYTFFAEIDDTMYLHIDGTSVIERSSYSGNEAVSDPIHLDPGYHDITISMQDLDGAARAILKWNSSIISKQIIPGENFYSNVDTGAPDGGVFVFDGDLFDQGASSMVVMGDAILLSSTGEALGGSLTIADIDENGYPDILAGNSMGTEVFFGQNNIEGTIQQATFNGFEQPVMVETDGGQALAAVVSDEIRLFSMEPDEYRLDAIQTEDHFQGTYNLTTFDDGLTIYAYERFWILPNGDFESGWDNWTQAENMREKNDGLWELTTDEHGDWHVYDGSTAGLGPDQDTLNEGGGWDGGKACDGLLFSDPFLIPTDVKFIDFWHHAKWHTFEVYGDQYQLEPYDDMIIYRLRRASNDEIVEEIIYRKPPTSGEEEGRLQFDVADFEGEYLIFEMEMVCDYHQYDDGIAQIDDITGLKTVPDAKGDFISDTTDLGFILGSLYSHWDMELNNGSIEVFFRTNTSDEWTILENDKLIEISGNEDTTFQYKVTLEAAPGEQYPVLEGLFFNQYAYSPDSIGPGIPYNGGDIFGNNSLARVDGTTIEVYNDTTVAITITSDHPIEALASYMDIDRNGVPDLIVSSDNTVYLLPMDGTEGELELSDTPYTFTGDDGFGHMLVGNLVGSPNEHNGDGRVYLLPTGLNDTAIFGLNLENNSLIYPDTMISLEVTLQNKGLYDMDDVEVTMEITDGSRYTYQDSTNVTIDSWEGLTVTFDWAVPEEEDAAYHITFSLSPDDENSNNYYSIDLSSHYHSLDITTTKDYDAIKPGDVLQYDLEVTDLGTFGSDNITFDSDLPGDWDWWVKIGGNNVTFVVVEDIIDLELFVQPNTTVLGEYPFEFMVISENGVTNAPQDLVCHIVEADLTPVGATFLREDGKEAKIVAGDDSILVLEIENLGTQDTGSFSVYLVVDDVPDHEESAQGIPGTDNILINFTKSFSEGVHDLIFIVDVGDNVKEYDEDNNMFTTQIEVWPEIATSPFIFKVKVIDRFGENVTNANVTATSGVSFVENNTDDNGNSTLILLTNYTEGSIYRVEAFSGDLYTSVNIRVYSEDLMVEIVMPVGRYSLIIDSDERDKYILPGGQQSYSFNVTNTGDFNDNFTVTIEGVPEDWYANISGDGLVDGILFLENDGKTTLTLELESWKYAPAFHRYEVIVEVASTISPVAKKNFNSRTTLLPVENITLDTENPTSSGTPSHNVYHRTYIRNEGNTIRNITMMLAGDIEYAVLDDYHFTLEPGEEDDFWLTIGIPNLRAGTKLNYELKGIVIGVGETNSIDIITEIEPDTDISISISGETLVVKNYGNVLEHLSFILEHENMNFSLQSSEIDIDMGETVHIPMDVEMLSMDIEAGSKIVIDVSFFNGDLWSYAKPNLVVPEVLNLELIPDSASIQALPGSTAIYEIVVKNAGNRDVDVFLSAVIDGDEPLFFPSAIFLPLGSETEIYLDVMIPEGATGQRAITFMATAGDHTEETDLQLDLGFSRGIQLDLLSQRGVNGGVRYNIKAYNNGDITELVDFDTNCGMLSLLQVQIEAGGELQLYLFVPPGTVCPGTIIVNATADETLGIIDTLELVPPPLAEIQIVSSFPLSTMKQVDFRATVQGENTYEWIIDEMNLQGDEVSYAFSTSGTYLITLIVTDSRDTDPNIITMSSVEIKISNQLPIVKSSLYITANIDDYIEFDGTECSDPDGIIVNYEWIIEDEAFNGPHVYYQFRESGVYNVTLTVTDNHGSTNTTTVQVTIRDDSTDDISEVEKEELNVLILSFSAMLLLVLIGIIAFMFLKLGKEEDLIMLKLLDVEKQATSHDEEK